MTIELDSLKEMVANAICLYTRWFFGAIGHQLCPQTRVILSISWILGRIFITQIILNLNYIRLFNKYLMLILIQVILDLSLYINIIKFVISNTIS